jgi:hypothetical protein
MTARGPARGREQDSAYEPSRHYPEGAFDDWESYFKKELLVTPLL